MRELFILLFLFVILVLVKKENYGQMTQSQYAIITGIGLDININTWLNSTYSGVSGGLGSRQNYDAQLAPSSHFILQMGDLNRVCWSDTTGLCVGFRKQLQAGGGGQVWYLYCIGGNFPPTASPTESQSYNSPIIATVKNFDIPQFIIVLKSAISPNTGECSWVKTAHTCVTSPPSQCNTLGTYSDTYTVTNWVANQCFGTEGQALVDGTQTVTGASCTTPPCNSGYDNGIPGTVAGGTGQVSLTATNAVACQTACTNSTGCKIAQFSPPSTCTGYATKTGINTGTSSIVYTHP
jgi:hypothetical protein